MPNGFDNKFIHGSLGEFRIYIVALVESFDDTPTLVKHQRWRLGVSFFRYVCRL